MPSWTSLNDRIALFGMINRVCTECKELFRRGPRVLHCSSPIYIFGDIHGNLKDLMLYDHILWHWAPYGFVANCLFLGDYVSFHICVIFYFHY